MGPATTPSASPPMSMPTPNAAMSSDTDGVGQLRIASLLSVLVQAMVWIGVAITYLIVNALQNSATSALGTASAPTIPSWITPNTFFLSIGLFAGGLFIGIVGFVFFFLGFRSIRRGAPDFGAPTTLMLIGLIGYLFMALGSVVIIGAIISAINAATSSPGTASFALGAVLGGIGLIGLGAILGLIGVIGLVLGNWRAGKRYDEGSVRVGSILTFIPFVSIVGFILLLVGYSRASSKMRTGWSPARPMGYGVPPTPMAAAPPTPGMAAPAAGVCPSCGQPTTWMAQYNRWYCTKEQKYV